MKRIAELVGLPLAWAQPSARKWEFELRAGSDVAATLVFRSMFGSFATGQSGDESWTFKRVGFWVTRATIREAGSEVEIGSFKNSTWKGGGWLELPDGRRFRATTNMWQTNLEFRDVSGAPLMRIKSGGVIHQSAAVELLPQALEVPEMRWILLLGWYLTVMMRMDAAAGAAAAGAAAG